MISGVEKRAAHKEHYERYRMLQLQDDEVERLHRDLETLYRKIAETHNNYIETRAKQKRKISELKGALSSVPRNTEIEIATLTAQHAQAMHSLRVVHSEKLKEMRGEYETRVAEMAEVSSVQEKVERDRLADAIGMTRAKIGDIINLSDEKTELRTTVLLQRIAIETEANKTRAKQLKHDVRKMTKALAKAKRLAATEQVRMQIDIPDVDSSLEEHTFLFEQSNMDSEEAKFREMAEVELEKLQKKVDAAKKRAARAKRLVDKAQQNEELADANDDLESLERERDSLEVRVKDDGHSASAETKTEHARQRNMRKQIRVIQEEMKRIRVENSALLAELRRVEFVIFGPKTRRKRSE